MWLIGSGCSNHMNGLRELFNELDETQTQKVKLGDNMEMLVKGNDIVVIWMSHGKVKLLHDVKYVWKVAHNLLSVGQLTAPSYLATFKGLKCIITNKESGYHIGKLQKTLNNMFPLEVSSIEKFSLTVKELSNTTLWMLRFGHLNVKRLRLLSKKAMVCVLSDIKTIETCEWCVCGKQTRRSFLIRSLCGSTYFILFINDFSSMS